MIQQALSGMIRLMLAKFIVNDLPHSILGEATIVAKTSEFIDLDKPSNRAEVYRVRGGYKKFSEVFDKDYMVRLYRGVYFPKGEIVRTLKYPGDFWTPSLTEAQSYASVVLPEPGFMQIYSVDLHLSDIVSPRVRILIEEPTVWEEGIMLPKELQGRSKLLSTGEAKCP